MRLRLHFDERALGEFWLDEHGVVRTDPPRLREGYESTWVTGWPQHDPGRVIGIDEGELWLHGMLWMSEAARLGGGRTWLAIVGDPRTVPLPSGVSWALGRRSGKTTMAALVALHDCLLRPELDGLGTRGCMPSVSLGRYVRFERSEVERWVAEQRTSGGAS
jgi:hypothetical protein